jgi:hypothetical protein
MGPPEERQPCAADDFHGMSIVAAMGNVDLAHSHTC